jgi:hypothetical protein
MTTPEDCRRKSEQWLAAAEATANPDTSATMLRVSQLWHRLAQDIKNSGSPAAQPTRPRDLARPRIDAVQVGDVLRNRLRISERDDDGSGNGQ